ncbi:hypothetical protein OIDMADRAFT_52034 [Oidiodendron maius Zn]|uniref:pyridoxal kinase n=1 Tax=Oidiodendron maius (strain Zn) TaxID=913774 RepID=A0A0C3HM79_OIDMZ|nr:hypothetical protein OIDMADRAFT_52034 [Oidiodendron maius Zn]
MSTDLPVPETRVLAIASHVSYGYVGNTMAVFVMQSLGCEVAAINTVHFSNHLGYGQVKGTRVSASEITDLYEGLTQSNLNDFDMMLTGYLPGAASVEAAGKIGRDLKYKATTRPGSLFWVLDPVMGDNGKLYVAADVVPAYKNLIKDADLILPNQFEAEILSDVKIVDMETLKDAIKVLHERYRIPHILITSVSLPSPGAERHLSVIGSTLTSTATPRIFTVTVPTIDCHFNGTGDMFAALMVVRLREAVSTVEGLSDKGSWVSNDEVEAPNLPLARATEKVLASMHNVLLKTKQKKDIEVEKYKAKTDGKLEEDQKQYKLVIARASEVSVVRNVDSLKNPSVRFTAEKI